MEDLLNLFSLPETWLALSTLILMEVILGIDNLIFISILTNKLPPEKQSRTRQIGILMALVLRLGLLATLAFIVSLTKPVFTVFDQGFSWRDIIMLLGGLFHALLGTVIGRIRFALPPLVTGLVVTMIGLALVKVGIQYAAGGVPAFGTPAYGSLLNWSAALVVIFVTLGIKFFTRGMLSISAVLIGLIVGYIYALAVGMLSFGDISGSWSRSAAFALPNPLKYGFEFSAAAIIGFCLMAFISAIETVGDVAGITKGGAGREATDREIQGATYADGIGPWMGHVLGDDGTPTDLVRDAHAAGLKVHPWTVRKENVFLPPRSVVVTFVDEHSSGLMVEPRGRHCRYTPARDDSVAERIFRVRFFFREAHVACGPIREDEGHPGLQSPHNGCSHPDVITVQRHGATEHVTLQGFGRLEPGAFGPGTGCVVKVEDKSRTEGYDVTYTFNDNEETIRMDKKPGERLRIEDGDVVIQ